jgi:hypothetical protein
MSFQFIQSVVPFPIAAWTKIRLRQLRNHRIKPTFTHTADAKQGCANLSQVVVVGYQNGQIHQLAQAYLRFMNLLKVREQPLSRRDSEPKGIQQIRDRPWFIKIVRMAHLTLQQVAPACLMFLLGVLELDQRNAASRQSKLTGNILARNTLLAQLENLLIASFDCLHAMQIEDTVAKSEP